jgi:hypothetical protein
VTLIEAVLQYKPCGVGDDVGGSIPIGKTTDPSVLRALRDRLLEEAAKEARTWREIDPGVATMRTADLERLARILSFLLPDEATKPALHLVGQDHGDEGA